ncbi:MAG: MarR family transcriptional regulator [Candidatus Thorarchaeota archaeon]|nr:MAG: MarR family transcriptional regulator [Candidatus Thorarchaeota archaeon]
MKPAKIPKSAVLVLDKLAKEGPLTPGELSIRVKIPIRTVSFALKLLRKSGLCKRRHNLHDMRQPLYYANRPRIDELEIDLNRWRAEQRRFFRIV